MVKGLFRGCLIGIGIIIVISVLGSMFGNKKAPASAQLVTAPPTQTSAPIPTLQPTDVPAVEVVTPEVTVAAAIRPGVEPVDGQCSGEYAIKGNIGDDRIYHLPTTSLYNRTKAEVCFATIPDAVAAGFRAPR